MHGTRHSPKRRKHALTNPAIPQLLHCNINPHIRGRRIRTARVLVVNAPEPGYLTIRVLRLPLGAIRHGGRSKAAIRIRAVFALCDFLCSSRERVDEPVADPGRVGAVGAEGDFDIVDGFGFEELAFELDGVRFALA